MSGNGNGIAEQKDERPDLRLPIIAAASVSIVFGFSFLFTANALDQVSAFQLLGFRFLTAAIALTVLGLLGLIKVRLKGKPLKGLLALAIFQPGLYFVFENTGIKMTSSSEAGLMIALIPVVVAVLARFFADERLTMAQVLSIGISLAGVLLIVSSGGGLKLSGHYLGMMLLFGAVLSAGVYNILSRNLSRSFSPIEITFIMMWTGALLFNAISLSQHMIGNNELTTYFTDLFKPGVLGAVLYLGLLSSVLAFFALNFVLSKLPASRAAVFSNLTTIVSVIAGVTFRGESFGPLHVIGGILILAGVWGTNFYTPRARKTKLAKSTS